MSPFHRSLDSLRPDCSPSPALDVLNTARSSLPCSPQVSSCSESVPRATDTLSLPAPLHWDSVPSAPLGLGPPPAASLGASQLGPRYAFSQVVWLTIRCGTLFSHFFRIINWGSLGTSAHTCLPLFPTWGSPLQKGFHNNDNKNSSNNNKLFLMAFFSL